MITKLRVALYRPVAPSSVISAPTVRSPAFTAVASPVDIRRVPVPLRSWGVKASKLRAAKKEPDWPTKDTKPFSVKLLVTAIKELANYYSVLKDDYLEHYSFIAKARQSFDAFETTLIATILQEGVQKDIFEVENVNLTAEAIVGALKGLEYKWTVEMPIERIEKSIDTLLKILFKGIEKRE